MPQLGVQLAIVVSVIFFLSSQSSANVLRSAATLPKDSDDEYYQKFQEFPSLNDTAIKLMQNFLHIGRPNGFVDRRRRAVNRFFEDIVIVMDGSWSIGNCEFEKGKKALKYMLRLAGSSSGYDSKYAVVTFSTNATVNFKFLSYSAVSERITQLSYPGGFTNTNSGLAEAKKLFDNPSSGRRPNSRKMVFLVTDGRSSDKQGTVFKATEIKNRGMEIFVVAVGAYLDGVDEMVKVSSSPHDRYLFRVKTLSSFFKVVMLIIKEVGVNYVLPQYEPPC
ncbi:collagen alpha-1(XIV) chain-like [Montipora capricornis]|uniref:collagen alpha-1(XIV) chain-like n=1 Tax=Montipora capricornis TaxID=246305 RepID=UPI0035F13041